jgi:hypothetical protein
MATLAETAGLILDMYFNLSHQLIGTQVIKYCLP